MWYPSNLFNEIIKNGWISFKKLSSEVLFPDETKFQMGSVDNLVSSMKVGIVSSSLKEQKSNPILSRQQRLIFWDYENPLCYCRRWISLAVFSERLSRNYWRLSYRTAFSSSTTQWCEVWIIFRRNIAKSIRKYTSKMKYVVDIGWATSSFWFS